MLPRDRDGRSAPFARKQDTTSRVEIARRVGRAHSAAAEIRALEVFLPVGGIR